MTVALRPMIDETYLAYLSQHEQEYARDRMITDRESLQEALRTTRAQHQALLPQGLLTPNHHFYTVEDETRNRRVGYVWIAYRSEGRELFLYDILIFEAERRKGYGRSALEAIDEKAQELGCRAIWLNVMAHNQSAIDFYLAQGYRVGTMHMSKHLERR